VTSGRKLAIALGVLALVAAGAVFWIYYSLDFIVKVALEYYGPDVVGAPVKVASVRISAQTGEGRLSGMEIGSPAGFTAPRAAKLGDIRVSIDPATLTSSVIAIREVALDSPLITYERGKNGGNLEAIQKHIQDYVRDSARREGEANSPSPTRDARRFTVDHIAIRGAKVTMTNPALKGQGITFNLPDVLLKDVGKRENGLRASEIADIVARELLSKIAQRVLTNIDLLRKGGVEGAEDALRGLFK
jgi:hypothetical protein